MPKSPSIISFLFALMLLSGAHAGNRKPLPIPTPSPPTREQLDWMVTHGSDDTMGYVLRLVATPAVDPTKFEGTWKSSGSYGSASAVHLRATKTDTSARIQRPEPTETITFERRGETVWAESMLNRHSEYADRPVSFVGQFATYAYDAGFNNRAAVICILQPADVLVCWDDVKNREESHTGYSMSFYGLHEYKKLPKDAR